MHQSFHTYVPVKKDPLPWFVRAAISDLFTEGKWVVDAINLGLVWLVTYQDGSRVEGIYVSDLDTIGASNV